MLQSYVHTYHQYDQLVFIHPYNMVPILKCIAVISNLIHFYQHRLPIYTLEEKLYVLQQYWLSICKGQYKFPLNGWHLSFFRIVNNFHNISCSAIQGTISYIISCTYTGTGQLMNSIVILMTVQMIDHTVNSLTFSYSYTCLIHA